MSAAGADPAGIFFPPFQCPSVPANPACTGAAGDTCPAGTITQPSGVTGVSLCEQQPMPTMGTTTQITEDVAGGNGYPALTNIKVPASGGVSDPVHILTINGTDVSANIDPLATVKLDPNTDVTIVWNCNPATKTPGDGCSTATSFDLTGLIVAASPSTPFAFGLKYGAAQCVEQTKSATSSVTLKAAAVKAMLNNGALTTGSAFIVLARLRANVTNRNGHNIFFTAGKGQFSSHALP